jgi:hypothetical protein
MSGYCGGVGPSKTKEETTYKEVRASDIGALTTLGIFALTDRKSRMMVVHLDQLAPYQGAVWDKWP